MRGQAIPASTNHPPNWRTFRALNRSVSRLEADGYQVARVAPNEKRTKKRTAMDAVNVIAFREVEVVFVAVRTDRGLSPAESNRLQKMAGDLTKTTKVVEWRWDERAREPVETEIA